MKKILALALVVVLMMTMSITAFAETYNSQGELPATETQPVYVGYDADGDGLVDDEDTDGYTYQINIDVTWAQETIQFNYINDWDSFTLSYDGYWAGNDHYVTVTNRSNVGIDCKFSYETETGYDDATVSFSMREVASTDENGDAIFDADGNQTYEAAPSYKATLTDDTLTLGFGNDGDVVTESGDPQAPYAEISVKMNENYEPAANADDPTADYTIKVGTITLVISANTQSGGSQSPEVVSEIVFSNSSDNEFTVKRGETIPISGTYNGYSVKVSSTLVLEGMTFDKDAQTLTFDMVGVYPPMIFVTTDLNYDGTGEAPITGEVDLNITVVD